MVGKRRMLVVSVGCFAVGSVVSAVGGSYALVLTGRVVQGVAGGMFPLVFGILRDELRPERVGSAIGFVSSTLGIGGGVGLLLGGAMVDALGYTSIFWLGAVTSAISIVAILLLVPESPTRTPGRTDLRGAALLAAGLVTGLLGVSEGPAWGWGDGRVLAMLLAGPLVLAFWVWVQRRTAEPLVDIRTLSSKPVLLTNVATLLIGFGMFGGYVLVPQFVEAPVSTGYGFGGSATHAGLLMLPGSLCMLVLGPVSGSLGTRFGHQWALVLGAALSSAGLGLLAPFHGSDAEVLVCFTVLSAGIAVAFAAMPNLIVASVPATQTGQATGFNAVVRSVGSSVGTQVTAVVVASSIAAGATLPHDSGYTTAFALCSGVSLLAAVLALVVPATRAPHVLQGQERGAASLLPDPALAGDRA
jgi:MFS family permease